MPVIVFQGASAIALRWQVATEHARARRQSRPPCWSVVTRGIFRDPLQGVDSAQADVHRVFLPQLVDGPAQVRLNQVSVELALLPCTLIVEVALLLINPNPAPRTSIADSGWHS